MSTADATSFDPATLTGDYTFDAAHTMFGFVARHAMVQGTGDLQPVRRLGAPRFHRPGEVERHGQDQGREHRHR